MTVRPHAEEPERMLDRLRRQVMSNDEAQDAVDSFRTLAAERDALAERVAELETGLRTRAETWEAKATEAQDASDSYRGYDTEAAVQLARDANRARNRAAELREILASAVVGEPEDSDE